jgi:hypothetical protein
MMVKVLTVELRNKVVDVPGAYPVKDKVLI